MHLPVPVAVEALVAVEEEALAEEEEVSVVAGVVGVAIMLPMKVVAGAVEVAVLLY